MSEQDIQTIVIDDGSGLFKAGYSGEEAPRSIFPSVVGLRKYIHPFLGHSRKNVFIGDEAYDLSIILNLKYPIERGIVNNWDNMEKICQYTFYKELRVDPTEHPVILTEATMTPKADRERMISLMFETFEVPSFYVKNQAILSLFSSRRITGIVFESGYGISQIVPVLEGYSLPEGISKIDIAGCDLNDWMAQQLTSRGFSFKSVAEKEIVSSIREKLCYVALDYNAEMEKAATSTEINRIYELPDGRIITLGDERFRCPEILFNPSLFYKSNDGIHKEIVNSVMKCDKNVRNDLFANIVLSGRTTMLEGLAERLKKEITNLTQPTTENVNVVQNEYWCGAWTGASILSSISTFPQIVITKEEFDEVGPMIVHLKCYQ